MKYFIPDHGETQEDAEEITVKVCKDPQHDHWTAESIAEWGYAHRDWWECWWPMTICLMDTSGDISRWSVEREMVPEFSASEAGK